MSALCSSWFFTVSGHTTTACKRGFKKLGRNFLIHADSWYSSCRTPQVFQVCIYIHTVYNRYIQQPLASRVEFVLSRNTWILDLRNLQLIWSLPAFQLIPGRGISLYLPEIMNKKLTHLLLWEETQTKMTTSCYQVLPPDNSRVTPLLRTHVDFVINLFSVTQTDIMKYCDSKLRFSRWSWFLCV